MGIAWEWGQKLLLCSCSFRNGGQHFFALCFTGAGLADIVDHCGIHERGVGFLQRSQPHLKTVLRGRVAHAHSQYST